MPLYFGDTLGFTGDTGSYIGASAWSPLTTGTELVKGALNELWIYKDENDNIITEIEATGFGPGEAVLQGLKIQYKGYNPVHVSGFYLRSIPDPIYEGGKTAIIDKAELIRWGDEYAGSTVSADGAGLHLIQTSASTSLPVNTRFTSAAGGGSEEYDPIPYVGHTNGLVGYNEEILIALKLTAPSATEGQIKKAIKLHFAIEILSSEIPTNLLGLI